MIPPVLVTVDLVVLALAQLVGLAVLAATLAAAVAVSYRWVTREPIPLGVALLSGLAGVVVYLSATTVLGGIVDSEMDILSGALYNILAFVFGAVGAVTGHRLGDSFGNEVLLGTTVEQRDNELSQLVKTVGRVTAITVPERIDDIVGYDSVQPETKRALAGEQFVFPSSLTREEVRDRLQSRIKSDYGVQLVELQLAPDGSIDHLAVGKRAGGIGPTLPPATNAVALRADPAFDASTGDIVQVWEADPMRRVLTGELRGVAGDIVTVAINSADTPKVDPTRTYRLVTLPVEDRPAREFASLLRAAEESFTSVTVEAGSPLHGMVVGALVLTVVSVRPEDGEPVALPAYNYLLSPGDSVFAVGSPAMLGTLERAAEPLDPALGSKTSTPADAGTSGRPADGSQSTKSATESKDQVDTRGGVPSFDELEAESRSGEDWTETDDSETESDPVENVSADDSASSGETVENTASRSFDELKDAFDSGETDWTDTSDDGEQQPARHNGGSEDPETAEASSATETAATETEDLVNLEDADINFEEEPETEDKDSNDLSSLDVDSASDLSSLDIGDDSEFDTAEDTGDALFEDDPFGDDDFSDEGADPFDGAAETDNQGEDIESHKQRTESGGTSERGDGEEDHSEQTVDDNNDDGSDAREGDEADDSSGGASTFQQLKEEFESGEADWEDEISDSPGGDMRLDE